MPVVKVTLLAIHIGLTMRLYLLVVEMQMWAWAQVATV